MIRVVVGDGHYLRREGICRLLAEAAETELLAVATEPAALLDSVRLRGPDAVLTSFDACAVRREFPRIGVVVLARHERPALALFDHGTAGLAYLVEDRVGDFGEVVTALREVVAGRSVVDPLLVHRAPIARLTARELDVVRHMAQGRTNRAIAEALTVAESTVEKHVNTAFAKLGLSGDPRQHRRVAAVLAYLRHQDRNVREIPSLPA
ncbi:response regulator transcription factor [Lentzea alba]|uniref:response regulator transcription factor n=1 Tax=Lentzea alba TaxID=2714351 RepID=UPI0039BFA040